MKFKKEKLSLPVKTIDPGAPLTSTDAFPPAVFCINDQFEGSKGPENCAEAIEKKVIEKIVKSSFIFFVLKFEQK